MMGWTWHYNSVVFLSKTHNISLIVRKTLDKFQKRGSVIYMTSTPQNYQGRQKQGKIENLSQLRGA